jgi:Metallo-beta-lactamase superfamily
MGRDALVRILGGAIRKRSPEVTQAQVAMLADLWALRIDLCTIRVLGLFSPAAWKRFAEHFHMKRRQLGPVLSPIWERLGELMEADGLWEQVVEARNGATFGAPRHYRCTAEMVQWAVGQGGFWTTSGRLRGPEGRPGRTFEVLFDCGTSTASGLVRAFREFHPAEGRIDYLFLSHFDRDHTSGVEHLLRNHRVDTVVMPLLSPAAALLTSSRLAASDALSDEQVQLLTNPGVYLRDRGVRRAILLESAPEGNGPEVPTAPTPDEPPQWSERAELDSSGSDPGSVSHIPIATVPSAWFPYTEVAPQPTTFWLTDSDGRAFWQLSPYVHPFEPLRIGRFMQSAYHLIDAVGGGDTRAALRSLIATAQGRRDLKRLYRLVRSDHNTVSMSLFSCPCVTGGSPQMWLNVASARSVHGPIQLRASRFGWMHTGDSTLARDSYRSAWLTYYQRIFDRVGVLVAPHHGSSHNFHGDLISFLKPPVVLACASRRNGFGHPASSVARAARAYGSDYHQVDEKQTNEVVGVYFG